MQLLTASNIKKGMRIITDDGRLATIIHVDPERRERYPKEVTFTYLPDGGHNCWTSVHERPQSYLKYIVGEC